MKESELSASPTDVERYFSMFGFDNTIYQHLEVTKTASGNPTVSGFKGNFFCRYLYFDIDSDNLEDSHNMAKNLTLLLYNILGVNPKSLFISFSGNKGFHIGLHQAIFGNFAPRKDMPLKMRILATKILCECFEVTMEELNKASESKGNKKVYNLMDLSIYNDNRIFRVINSKNLKSGLFKIGLTFEELNTLSIEQIKEKATTPQSYKPEIPAGQLVEMPEMKALWDFAVNFDSAAYDEGFKKTNKGTTSTSSIFFVPDEGGRNNAFFAQATHLADYSELSEGQILSIIQSINQGCKIPLPDDEIRTLVRSAFHKVRIKKAAQQEPKFEQKAISKEVEIYNDWLNEWAEYYMQEPKQFTYLFPQIDKDQEHNFSGKLACFIGQGGTRKSYGALNIVAQNVMSHNARVMYSSMEMGKVEMVNRLLDMSFEPEGGISASKICRRNLKIGGTEYLQQLKSAIVEYDDRLILSSVSDKTTEDYYRDYKKAVELYGAVDFLVVDGLSMMGGKGSETERFEKHTKELKGLANATGLNIILICHTTKEAKQWTRDTTGFARGSGKIFDNCDFTVSFSNLIDEQASTPENIEFVNNLGHIKYYNKRGTGLTLNAIYNFSGTTKKITPAQYDPRHFPEYDYFVKNYNRKNKSKDDDAFNVL